MTRTWVERPKVGEAVCAAIVSFNETIRHSAGFDGNGNASNTALVKALEISEYIGFRPMVIVRVTTKHAG